MPFAGAIASCSILLLLLAPCAEGQSPEATSEGFMIEQILSEKGCGAFAGLVAATAGVGEVFRFFLEKEVETPSVVEVFRKKSAGDVGLTIFCPDDEAVAAFVPRFNNLSADGQVALLLYHGLPVRCSEEALRLIDREVPTLDRGPRGYSSMLTIGDYGGIVVLSSSSPSFASVTKMVVDDDRLAVYLIDAVVIPIEPEIQLSASFCLLLVFGLLALFALLSVQLYIFILSRDG